MLTSSNCINRHLTSFGVSYLNSANTTDAVRRGNPLSTYVADVKDGKPSPAPCSPPGWAPEWY